MYIDVSFSSLMICTPVTMDARKSLKDDADVIAHEYRRRVNSNSDHNTVACCTPEYKGNVCMLCNRSFWWRFCVFTLIFGFFCGCRGFCYRTESGLFLFLLPQYVICEVMMRNLHTGQIASTDFAIYRWALNKMIMKYSKVTFCFK